MTNVALLGLKGHQYVCLQTIAQRPDVRLVAVWDDEPAALDSLRSSPAVTGETLLTTDLAAVLARRDVQVAVVCDDNGARARNLLACAERGWQIVAEKPLALTLADLDAVHTAVDRAGVRLSMLLTMRFEPPYLALKEQLDRRLIGRPLLLSGQKSYRRGERPAWQRHQATYGGTIPFIGIHVLDLLHWLTGCRYTRVAALQRNTGLPGAGEMEETAALLLATAEHGVVDVRLDYLRPGPAPSHGDDRIRIAGSDGVLEELDGHVTAITATAGPREVAQPPAGDLFGSFVDELAGGPPHPITAADCFLLTEVCLKARQAAETGQWVDL